MESKKIAFDSFVRKRYNKEYNRKLGYLKKSKEKNADYADYDNLAYFERAQEKRHVIKRIEFRVNSIIFKRDVYIDEKQKICIPILEKTKMFNYSIRDEEEILHHIECRYKEYDEQRITTKVKKYKDRIEELEIKLENISDKEETEIEKIKKEIYSCEKMLKRLNFTDFVDSECERYVYLTKKEEEFYNFILDNITNENLGKKKSNCQQLLKDNWSVLPIKKRKKLIEMIQDLRKEGWANISDEEMAEAEMRILTPEIWKIKYIKRNFVEYSEILEEFLTDDDAVTEEIKAAFTMIEKGNKLLKKVCDEKWANELIRPDGIDLQDKINELNEKFAKK